MDETRNSGLKWLETLKDISRYAAISAAVLSGLGILALVVMTLVNIFMRNAGSGGVPDSVGWGEVGVAAFAYLGLAYTQRLDAHVSTVVVVRLLPADWQRYIRIFWMTVICLLMLWVGFETTGSAIESTERLEARFGAVPVWPAKIAIAVGMWLLLLELLVQLLDTILGPQKTKEQLDVEAEEQMMADAI
jgi:TRAP-type C4-dicarboxylate transport system permease small subunit